MKDSERSMLSAFQMNVKLFRTEDQFTPMDVNTSKCKYNNCYILSTRVLIAIELFYVYLEIFDAQNPLEQILHSWLVPVRLTHLNNKVTQ